MNEALRPGRPGDCALWVPSMSAGPGCEPCTKRPRWGAATTSPPAALDSRSFPGRQRRVLDPKDAPVQFRVPPSSPGCVPGRAGPHRGGATSLGTWGNKNLCPKPRSEPFSVFSPRTWGSSYSYLVLYKCTTPSFPCSTTNATSGGQCHVFPDPLGGVRNFDGTVTGWKMAGDSPCLLSSDLLEKLP